MKLENAIFGAGCFWHVEHIFSQIKGVTDTRVGYSGGTKKNPKYKDVCSGNSGHAEVVEIKFNPKIINYSSLLDIFWKIHDPCSLNRQGLDIGEQYRSVIFPISKKQRERAIENKKYVNEKKYKKKIVKKIEKFEKFYLAEKYHQKYLEKRSDNKASCSVPKID